MFRSTKKINHYTELSAGSKVIAAILLIGFTAAPLVLLISLWPNNLPAADAKEAYYTGWPFNLQLSTTQHELHLNTIMFLLVALSGFLGSMIHLATSFTNYIGVGKFRRSWVLWYCVKPFTAAAVAMVFYMVLQAGLLNYNGAGGVNPFGVVILAALAGLFTDKATLKLEEIFSVMFKPKDERPNTLSETKLTVDSYDKQIVYGKDNIIAIKGKGFANKHLKITIHGEAVKDAVVTDELITLHYTIPADLKGETTVELALFDEADNKLFAGIMNVVPDFTDSMRSELDTRFDDTEDAATEIETVFVKG